MTALRTSALGLVALVGLASCGGGGGTGAGTNHDDMSPGQAAEVGNAIGGLVTGAFGAASKFTIDDGTLTDPTLAPGVKASHRDLLVARVLRIGAQASHAANPAGPSLDGGILGGGSCNPTHSSAPTDSLHDSDEDGIPNDDLLTFTAINCNYVNPFGVTVLVHGSAEIKDIGSIWGFQINFNSLTYDLSSGNGSATMVVTGSYSTSVGANLATTQEGVHMVITSSTGQVVSTTTSWSVNFVPDDPISGAATALPAGSLSLTGNFGYAHNSDSWQVILSSPEPMVYDGECAENPVFASGSLEGQIAIARTRGFHLQFQGCGATPVVTALGAAN